MHALINWKWKVSNELDSFVFVHIVPVIEALNYAAEVNCSNGDSQLEIHITLTVSMHAEIIDVGINAANRLPLSNRPFLCQIAFQGLYIISNTTRQPLMEKQTQPEMTLCWRLYLREKWFFLQLLQRVSLVLVPHGWRSYVSNANRALGINVCVIQIHQQIWI